MSESSTYSFLCSKMIIHGCHSLNYIILVFSMSVFGKINHVGFTELPSSMMVTPGTRATFRCRHETADVIGWRVNGTSIGQVGNPDFIPGTTRRGDGSLVHILTVVVRPEYNDTEIVCVAAFIQQEVPLELSPVVTLTVFEGCNETCTYEGFIEVPQSAIVAVETDALFTCRHISTDRISWIINGTTLLDESCLPNITTLSDSLSDGDVIHSLSVRGLATYNETYIQCAAYVQVQPDRTIPALLLIQEPLRAISGVFRENLANQEGVFYFWEPPSTLDLTGVEPDIVYCVEVSNITCGADNLIASDCELTNPIYPASVGDGLDPSYIYEITVTPRSNVPGAANGSVITRQEEFMNVEVFPTAVVESSPGVLVEFGVFINDTESERLVKARARSYSIEILSADDPQVSVTEIIEENNETITVVLSKRRRWIFSVFAYGCQQHPVSITKELSTFAVQNITVTSVSPGELGVTGDFISNTSAVGMLTIVYSTENDSDIHYTEARLPQTEIHLTGLSGNAYSVSVFDIEHHGLPFYQAATLPRSINITQGVSPVSASVSIYYKLQNISTGVCITCTFLDSSTTDCVVVVHQRISQLSSSGLMNIESSHKFNRSGDDIAFGCIEGVNLTAYQIGVIGAQIGFDVPISTLFNIRDYVAAVAVSWIILFFTLLVYFISIFCWRRALKKKKKKKQESENNKTAYELNILNSKSNKLNSNLDECNPQAELVSQTNIEVGEWESSRLSRTWNCDTNDKDLSTVHADVTPEVETSTGYEGTTELDLHLHVPLDIPCDERSSCTQPLSALRRNVPEIQCVESDCLLVSQSLKQLEVTNYLYYEDDDRCTSANISGLVSCAEDTEPHPTQVTDTRTPSSKEYMYLHLGSKLPLEEKHHQALSRSSSSEICVTKMTTAKQEGGTYILGLAEKSVNTFDSDRDLGINQGKILSIRRYPSNNGHDPQSSTNEDSYSDELLNCKHPVISTASLSSNVLL